MSTIKFSALDPAVTLVGTEIVPGVQAGGNVKITVDQIAARSANIYNSDGTVTAARTIDGGNNSMLWHTFDVFEVYSNSLIWQAGNHTIDLGTDLRLEADGDIDLDATDDLKINGTSGTTGQVISNTNGHAAWTTIIPAWSDWVPVFTGFSVNPTYVARYQRIGNTVHFYLTSTADGTSNTTAPNSTTFTLPFAAQNKQQIVATSIVDTGTVASAPGLGVVAASSSTMIIYRNASLATNWTGSGGKSFCISGSYEAQP